MVAMFGGAELLNARWCSGSTKDFGSFDRGSNPRRAAILSHAFSYDCDDCIKSCRASVEDLRQKSGASVGWE